jgi:hypothetical protein
VPAAKQEPPAAEIRLLVPQAVESTAETAHRNSFPF